MRVLPCLLLLGTVGCDALLDTDSDRPGWQPDTSVDTDTDTDTGTVAGCPAGLEPATSAEATFQILVVDGQQQTARLLGQSYDGMPAACVSADGLETQLLIGLNGEPWAWLRSYADGPTNIALNTTTGVELEAFANDPPVTWTDGDWYQGTWQVAAEGSGWSHRINGAARSDQVVVSMQVEIEVTP